MNYRCLHCMFSSITVLLLGLCPSLSAQVLDSKAVQSLGMTGSFTLTYDVTHRNAMSPEVKASLLKQWRAPLEMQLKQHVITQEQLDEQMKASAASLNFPPTQRQVSLVVQGDRFIYKQNGHGPSEVVVFDGKQTLEYTQAKNFQQRVTPGADIGSIRPILIPGVGTPYAPLIQMPTATGGSKGVMSFMGDVMAPSGSRMSSGKVDVSLVKGAPQVLSLVQYSTSKKRVLAKWTFAEHQLFQGKWVASQMTYTTYERQGPAEQFDFKLIKASPKVEDVDEFHLEHWLAKGDHMLYKGITFPFDPSRGSLDEQSEHAQPTGQDPIQNESSSQTIPEFVISKDNFTIARIKVGSEVSRFSIKDIDENLMSVAYHKGKVVLVDFWATWCASCRAETPLLVKLYKAHHDEGFEILSFSEDLFADSNTKSAMQKVRSYRQKEETEWPVALDKDFKIAYQLGLGGALPNNFLVGRDGKVYAINLHGDDIEDAVQAALKLK